MTKRPFLFPPFHPLTPEPLEEISKSLSYFSRSAAIGKSVNSGEIIRIGDKERRAGLYILGGKFIGTTLVSSLVHAVLNRSAVPSDKRHRFCIFVDEMQNFTTSDDFAVLFTQARKFGIATTIAHQDRYGQLGDNRPLAGIYREYAEQETALGRAETAILQARNKTAKLLFLFKRGKGLRLPIRALNRFLTAIMEGRMT